KLRAEIIRRVAGENMIDKFGWNELDSVAVVGVMEAIARYDPDHPSARSIETVLSYRIRQEIVKDEPRNFGANGMPDTAYRKGHKIDTMIGEDDAWNMTDSELEQITGEPSAGAIVRARLQPTDIMRPTDEEGETGLEPIEELADEPEDDTDISTLRMFGLLLKIDDERRRTLVARKWAY